MNHTEIAMASDGMSKLSPAANISSMYIPAASFILSSASCLEYPQLEQPGSTGTEVLHRPSASSVKAPFKTGVFIGISCIVVKVDFDLTMTIAAHNFYRIMAQVLAGFEKETSLGLNGKFFNPATRHRLVLQDLGTIFSSCSVVNP